MLNNYHPVDSYITPSTAQEVANFCLQPLVTAFGKDINIQGTPSPYCDNFNVTVEKNTSIAKKCFAAIVAVMLFPMTLLGLAARSISSHQKIYADWEASFYTQKAQKEEVLRTSTEILATKATTLSEKLDKSLRLATVINENYTHYLRLESAPQLISELKKVLIETVATPTVADTPWRELSCKPLEDFRANVSYKEILHLKRMLYRLSYLESHRNIETQENEPRFCHFYQAVRATYYDQFSGEHLANNLRNKGKITAMKLEMPGLSPETIVGVQEAYQQAIHPAQVTWMHGTGAATLAAVATTDGQVKPSGQLRENVVFNGENNQGCYGVNESGISGCTLDNFELVLNYAKGLGIGKHKSEEVILAKNYPLAVIKMYTEVLPKVEAEVEEYYNCYINTDDLSNLYNFHRTFRVLQSVAPTEFKETLIPIILKLNEKLTQQGDQMSTSLRTKMFEPILNFTTPTSYDEADRELIQRNFPIIFAATEIKTSQDEENKDAQKVAHYMGGVTREYLYKGSLKVGSDLPLLFVPQEEVERTRRYLQSKKIENVRVHNLETLTIAKKFKEFTARKRRSQGYQQFFDKPLKTNSLNS
jgi:hypothetical protein